MKFNVEIDIDWVDEESNIDDEIRNRIVADLSKQVISKFSDGVSKQISIDAERLVRAKTELIINTVLEKPITISEGWNNKTEYDSIYDMIEKRMSKLYEDKLMTTGKCVADPLLKNIEKYVDSITKKLLFDVEKAIKIHSENAAKKCVKEVKCR